MSARTYATGGPSRLELRAQEHPATFVRHRSLACQRVTRPRGEGGAGSITGEAAGAPRGSVTSGPLDSSSGALPPRQERSSILPCLEGRVGRSCAPANLVIAALSRAAEARHRRSAVCGSGVGGRAALALSLGGPALGLKAPLARRRRGTSGAAALGSGERAREPRAQASQSQFAVARLRSLVLRDRHQARSSTRQHPLALSVGQRPRGEHVKARFHTGGRDIGVLSPRSGGAACTHRNLREGNRQLPSDPQTLTGALFGFRRSCHGGRDQSRFSRISFARDHWPGATTR
jgi:hypothetical protein